MSGVPYLYVNVTALCCYALMFTAFIASKKTRAIRWFIFMLAGFMLWCGGSILMRLQLFPGVEFWYYVSILSLFSLAFLIYMFVCAFTGWRGYFLKIVWGISTLVILVLTALGVFLAPPQVVTENGQTVFLYTMRWPVAIPFAYFLLIVLSIALIFRTVIRERGVRSPGILAILCGCLSVTLGNFLQIIPGNVFPWDTLSGILFAAFLMYALYRKHMFRLTLQVSRSVVTIASAAIFVAGGINLFTPAVDWLTETATLSPDAATAVVLVLFAVALSLVYAVIRKMMDSLYSREEKQNLLIKTFSDKAARSLDTQAILQELVNVIRQEVPVEQIYMCLPGEDGDFTARCSARPLGRLTFSLAGDCPMVKYLQEGQNFLLMDEFENTPYALSLWQKEQELIRSLDIRCMIPLRKEKQIVGLALLGRKERSSRYTYMELDFLTTLASVASIAVDNARLYEQMFRKARTDSLTGVWNYTHFMERIQQVWEQAGGAPLSLLYVDIDDFKLYNQLYGSKEGDWVLCRVAEAIRSCAGERGETFRCAGKVFALLMPGSDVREAGTAAREIQRRVAQLKEFPGRENQKTVTVSIGICAYPYAASGVKELMDNADLAVYTAKNRGKGNVTVFHGSKPSAKALAERAREVVDFFRTKNGGDLDASLSTVYALTAAIDAKDHYTYAHSQNVARYSSIVALAAGLSDEQVSMIYEAGLLHDIGKISVPESILLKTGRLDEKEYGIIRTHVNNSIEMIRHLPNMDYLVPYVVSHHERWDGKGYPRGLAGEEIPLPARCLAVADAFDAMTTDRPYRKGMPAEQAAEAIAAEAGKQFDPEIALLFVRLVRSGDIQVFKN